jgi:hypothetical protein
MIKPKTLYDALNEHALRERPSKRTRGKRSDARNGVFRKAYDRYLHSLAWTFHPTISIGSGCQVHLGAKELPTGRLIVRLSKHVAAVIDDVIHGTHDPSRRGTCCVYGYYSKQAAA